MEPKTRGAPLGLNTLRICPSVGVDKLHTVVHTQVFQPVVPMAVIGLPGVGEDLSPRSNVLDDQGQHCLLITVIARTDLQPKRSGIDLYGSKNSEAFHNAAVLIFATP